MSAVEGKEIMKDLDNSKQSAEAEGKGSKTTQDVKSEKSAKIIEDKVSLFSKCLIENRGNKERTF